MLASNLTEKKNLLFEKNARNVSGKIKIYVENLNYAQQRTKNGCLIICPQPRGQFRMK